MTYSVKEIFYTLQGEGRNAGKPAVFCRFSGCNLWSGREVDRATAVCRFCDTDFVGVDGDGGGKFDTPSALAQAIASFWPAGVKTQPFVVCTGGEPLIQLNSALIEALQDLDFQIAVETNGTIEIPEGIDWVCVSPKSHAELTVRSGSELKVVYPQDADPSQYEDLAFEYFFIQPMDGVAQRANIEAAIQFCLAHPQWRLSLQTHKLVGLR
jgi:7-carboxy-7-deazaguanine synthase (Cx14CxxC type)